MQPLTGLEKQMMEKKLLTPGEMIQIIRELRAMGVTKGRVGMIDFEFGPAPFQQREVAPEKSPEEYEELLKKARLEQERELFGAT